MPSRPQSITAQAFLLKCYDFKLIVVSIVIEGEGLCANETAPPAGLVQDRIALVASLLLLPRGSVGFVILSWPLQTSALASISFPFLAAAH